MNECGDWAIDAPSPGKGVSRRCAGNVNFIMKRFHAWYSGNHDPVKQTRKCAGILMQGQEIEVKESPVVAWAAAGAGRCTRALLLWPLGVLGGHCYSP